MSYNKRYIYIYKIHENRDRSKQDKVETTAASSRLVKTSRVGGVKSGTEVDIEMPSAFPRATQSIPLAERSGPDNKLKRGLRGSEPVLIAIPPSLSVCVSTYRWFN